MVMKAIVFLLKFQSYKLKITIVLLLENDFVEAFCELRSLNSCPPLFGARIVISHAFTFDMQLCDVSDDK